MNSELNEQQSKEVTQYVRDCITEHTSKNFDITKIPLKLDHKTSRGILDIIYKTVKYKTSKAEQKNIAIKMLKSIILKTKSTSFINLFLICQLWNFFRQQFRSYIKNNNETPCLLYSESYFELLEDMLQSFAQQLGRDNNNIETPFSMYWKAVHNEKKNSYMTKFTLYMILLTPKNKVALQYIQNHFKNYYQREECKYFIRQFFEKYQKKSKIVDSFLEIEKPNFEHCHFFKIEFLKFCEREFFFGHIEDQVYDDYEKVVDLEKFKVDTQSNNFQSIQQSHLSQQQQPSNHQSYISNQKQNNNQSYLSNLQQQSNHQSYLSNQQSNQSIKRNTSIANRSDEMQSFEIPQIKVNQNNQILNSQNEQSFISDSQEQISPVQKNSTIFKKQNTQRVNAYQQSNDQNKQNSSYFKKKYDLNLEKEVSQIHNDSIQVDLQSENQSYRQILNILSRGLEINPKRLELQKNLSQDDLYRMKSFAFIDKAKLYANNYIKVGVCVSKSFGGNKYEKIIVVQCFWETMFENIKNIQANIKHQTEKFFVNKKPNKIEFECKNFYQDLNFPQLHLTYFFNNQVNNIDMQILIPINKFMFIPRQTSMDLNKFQTKGYKVLISDQYPLDINFFKRIKELKFIFKNFQEINDNTLAVDAIYMEIKVFENFTFVAQLRYFPNGIEEFLQNFLQEIVFLLSEYGNTNYQLFFNFSIIFLNFCFTMIKKTKRMFSSLLSSKTKRYFKK